MNAVIWTLIVLYVGLIVLLHLPTVQRGLGNICAGALENKFGTKAAVGRVDVGFLNRLILDDVWMLDQNGDTLLSASRLAVRTDLLPLLKGKVAISSAQLFGLQARLYKKSADAPPNYQFVIDSLSSHGNTRRTNLDLSMGSLIIRHGRIQYDQCDKAPSRTLDPHHLNFSEVSGHLLLHHLSRRQIDLSVRQLSFKEASGLMVKRLRFHLTADTRHALITDFSLKLPHTHLKLGTLTFTYHTLQGKISLPSLTFRGSILSSSITPSDFSFLLLPLAHFENPVLAAASFRGTPSQLQIRNFHVRSTIGSLGFRGSGSLYDNHRQLRWTANIDHSFIRSDGIRFLVENLGERFHIPQEIKRLGTIGFNGHAEGYAANLTMSGALQTDAGKAKVALHRQNQELTVEMETPGIDLRRILAQKELGKLAAHLEINGILPIQGWPNLKAKGNISIFEYGGYSYRNIQIDGQMVRGILSGTGKINDPHLALDVKGNIDFPTHQYAIESWIHHFSPSEFFKSTKASAHYVVQDVRIKASNWQKHSLLDITTPEARLHLEGHYQYTSLLQSMVNLLAEKLPTLPGLKKTTERTDNAFRFTADLTGADLLKNGFGIPLELHAPAHFEVGVDDREKKMDVNISLPEFVYDGQAFRSGSMSMTTPDDTLKAQAALCRENGTCFHLLVSAANNRVSSTFNFDNHSRSLRLQGTFLSQAQFYEDLTGQNTAHIKILPSSVLVGDSLWKVEPGDVYYRKNHLDIGEFSIEHGNQHLMVSGLATASPKDSLLVDLKNVDVGYVLNLVNFHTVDFSGKATGKARISSPFHSPGLAADLNVQQFEFEQGEMGTLHAHVRYNKVKEQIELQSIANDGPDATTRINGYVSPVHNRIDIGIHAEGTRLQFLESFCGSFMSDVDARGQGEVHVAGSLNHLNLTGDLIANGKIHIKTTDVDYTLKNFRFHAIPDQIQFPNDTIWDRTGNLGILSGAIFHQHLTKMSYELGLKVNHLLCYDTNSFGDDTFYGTVYATGDCTIKGKSGEVVFDINGKPDRGSEIVYNAASPDAADDQTFIHWRDMSRDTVTDDTLSRQTETDTGVQGDIPTDIRLNFLINADQNLTLKLLTDNQTGDYITLNGDGVIRATYFNKGTLDMFGNYVVDHGIYKLTIQNFIKKDFQFQQGGTIVFGGDPFHAALNLQALYTVNGVSLSDLNLGKSFASNNIRVNCLMNITGTPGTPKIDFTMDMPTLNSEARQMVYSLINSEEEMNQQILYLIAVGRFYSQGNNNAEAENAEQQNQTSLAMQSLLSGTISQQLNQVLSSVINNSNWNIGANISPGDEGWNNAEYEGLLSGRMFNNRLQFNGQFGYRDKANATTSFIGDFDLRYLLLPNGNLALRVYNQTNDRYFTRNSLTTQGLGFILKKDFNGWRDLFGIKKKGKKTNKSKSVKP